MRSEQTARQTGHAKQTGVPPASLLYKVGLEKLANLKLTINQNGTKRDVGQ